MYETPVASLESGAYAVRVTQTKAGEDPLGRTLGLVAPTAAEYRLLGANEPLLAAIRGATGGRAVETPAEVWVHDLQTTSRFTDLWPWLLVLALLLWPLDIALRRVSLGRRELADGRRWVVGPGPRAARRRPHDPTESLFAARERAGSAGARSAILREAAGRAEARCRPERIGGVATATPASRRPGSRRTAPRGRLRCPHPAATAPRHLLRRRRLTRAPPSVDPQPPPSRRRSDDTLTRLREAKRRKRT